MPFILRFILFILLSSQCIAHQSDKLSAKLFITNNQNYSMEINVNYLKLFVETFSEDFGANEVNQLLKMDVLEVQETFIDQFTQDFFIKHQSFKMNRLTEKNIKKMANQYLNYGYQQNRKLVITGEILHDGENFELSFPKWLGMVELTVINENNRFLSAGERINLLGSNTQTTNQSLRSVFQGILHIIPKGLDHILFIILLFLQGIGQRKPFHKLVLWSSLFTLAHCITLALASQYNGLFPSYLVEPLIALSIVFMAYSLLKNKPHKFMPLIIFSFGLLHGLGFSSVFLALQPNLYHWTTLISFNIGIEIGQILVLIVCGLTYKLCTYNKLFTPAKATNAISLLILMTGLFWTVERTLPFLS